MGALQLLKYAGFAVYSVALVLVGFAWDEHLQDRQFEHDDPPTAKITKVEGAVAGQPLGKRSGYRASGTYSGSLGDYQFWLMDLSRDTYTAARQVTLKNGEWSAVSAPLGDPSDKPPFEMRAVIVRANPDCVSILRRHIHQGKYDYQGLPPGCVDLRKGRLVVVEVP